ncbi:MAG: hypothetical protein HY308_16150 [Gammaproteobacteria bacterium]|nr:hypothetical protein [Gammaproteobacteria bacterium]
MAVDLSPACCGTGVTATLRLTKTGTGSGADVFAEYVFRNSLISQYKTSGTYLDILRPMEHICISFVDFQFKYIPYDDDNRATSPIIVGFDAATNTKH